MLQAIDIEVAAKVGSAEEAIREAGMLLVKSGHVRESYVDAMIQVYRQLGSYIVIAPGLALPHARPEAGVLRTGFSLITLKDAVAFGHADNDPVRVVVCLAAHDSSEHVTALQRLAVILGGKGMIERVAEARSAEAVLTLLAGLDS